MNNEPKNLQKENKEIYGPYHQHRRPDCANCLECRASCKTTPLLVDSYAEYVSLPGTPHTIRENAALIHGAERRARKRERSAPRGALCDVERLGVPQALAASEPFGLSRSV